MIATGDWNPVVVVQNLGMGIPALFFILFANWTTNHNLLYSSGMALLNIFPRLKRWKSTFICGILGTGLALTGIVNHLESWLTLLSYIFSPLLGVVLAELLMVGFVMGNEKSAVAVNFSALIAVGMAVVIEIFLPSQYAASLAGLTTAALIYILLKNVFHRLSKPNKTYCCRGSR
ncbi:cytosine permease [Desulfallas thermosapovorans]|uniref:cytosine permease n=1 Tax=Desulfallas thermosapovorans TaxID=58137 RepID=UPI001A9B2E42|nr:cytosine permease [Desulfallas thermosapovorans]